MKEKCFSSVWLTMAVGGEVEREMEAVVESLGFDLFRSKQRAELGE